MTSGLDMIVGGNTGETVVLCGSGVSAVGASPVPSWYDLNATVLDEIRQIAFQHVLTSTAARSAVASIVLDDVPLPAFSQLVADAFAGRFWLEILTVLDGMTPNDLHRLVAGLLADGRAAAAITTNFDTLLEKAAADRHLSLSVVHRGTAEPAIGPALYKIHGSVDRPESLIDLLLDKGLGLGRTTQAQLAAACKGRHLFVLGFSGDDFLWDADYLGLFAGGGLPSRETWAVRPGSLVGEGARAFLARLADAGVPVALPERDLSALAGPGPVAGGAGPDIGRLIRLRLGKLLHYPPTASLFLAMLLRLRGSTVEAATVRAETRLAIPRFESNLLHVATAPAAWALLGKEEHNGPQAMADLRRADLAMDRHALELARRGIVSNIPAGAEQSLLRAAIRQNAAVVCRRGRDIAMAGRLLADAMEYLKRVPGPEADRRMAGIRYQEALDNLVYNRTHVAMVALERSIGYARRCGDVVAEGHATLMLAMCLRAHREEEFAAELDKRATHLSRATSDRAWSRELGHLATTGKSILSSGRFADLAAAITPDPLLQAVVAARIADDPAGLAESLRDVAERDVRACGRDRLGQLLRSLDLAGGRSLYQRTVRTLAADPHGLTDPARFLLAVTEVGLTASTVTGDARRHLMQLGRDFGLRPYAFVPHGFEEGLTALERISVS